ncbi:MAG TPA: DUF3311 domain-containing protein [Verrucomicrobiae bacterium]|jgi:hypothetical protein|nr:DUF3311 domain-containing protein [Verrucomicrobiae bacterium]
MKTKRAWYWLLLAPFVGTLWPPFYNHADPALFGLPFFYWYQLLWVIVTSAILGLVFLMTRERSDV